jgi:hypothetical protein
MCYLISQPYLNLADWGNIPFRSSNPTREGVGVVSLPFLVVHHSYIAVESQTMVHYLLMFDESNT